MDTDGWIPTFDMLFLILITPWERPQGLDEEPVSGSVIKCASHQDVKIIKQDHHRLNGLTVYFLSFTSVNLLIILSVLNINSSSVLSPWYPITIETM